MMFETIIQSWFADYDSGYNDFVKALLSDDVKAMNVYMNRVAVTTFRFLTLEEKFPYPMTRTVRGVWKIRRRMR